MDPLETPDQAIAARRAGRRSVAAPKAEEPKADTWVVRRRWIPRLGADTLWARFWRRFRKARRKAGDLADADPGCLEIFGEGILVAIAFIVAVLLMLFVAGPLLVALVDVVILLLLAVLGLIARVLFRRPWLIEAHKPGTDALRWRVVGWGPSSQKVEEVRQSLAADVIPPDAEVLRN